MGFIGYYINKKNILSIIILLPILLLLAIESYGYFNAMIDSFPHHLLSFLVCFAIIILVVLNLFDKRLYKIITIIIVGLFCLIYYFKGGIINDEYETYRTLDSYEINFIGKIRVSSFSGTDEGNVEVITSTDEIHSIKVNGRRNGKYSFSIIDESENEYFFEYYYDNEIKSIVVNKK